MYLIVLLEFPLSGLLAVASVTAKSLLQGESRFLLKRSL